MSSATTMELARLAVKLEDARNTVRDLWGPDGYAAKVGPVREMLRSIAAKRGESVLAVATRAAKGAADSGSGMTALVILAAAWDEFNAAEGP